VCAGRLTALDAKTGKILWRSYTLPAPGEVGSETWPAGTTHAMRGGASIWNTPAPIRNWGWSTSPPALRS